MVMFKALTAPTFFRVYSSHDKYLKSPFRTRPQPPLGQALQTPIFQFSKLKHP